MINWYYGTGQIGQNSKVTRNVFHVMLTASYISLFIKIRLVFLKFSFLNHIYIFYTFYTYKTQEKREKVNVWGHPTRYGFLWPILKVLRYYQKPFQPSIHPNKFNHLSVMFMRFKLFRSNKKRLFSSTRKSGSSLEPLAEEFTLDQTDPNFKLAQLSENELSPETYGALTTS